MDIAELHRLLDDSAAAASWFEPLGVRDAAGARKNLVRIAEHGVTLDLLSVMCDQLAAEFPQLSDADMALNNLERFIAAARSPLAMGALFERDREALPTLLQILSTSQYLSDHLVRDPGGYDLLRLTEGAPIAKKELIGDLCAEVAALGDDEAVMAALRRFKHRETLRIAYGDIIRDQPLETVANQISYLAEAIVEAAIRAARRKLEARRGVPGGSDGRPARFVVLALGKLGGAELNYSSDIDLVLLYDGDGRTDGERGQSNQEFFGRLSREMIRLLTETTDLGSAYRVDLRLRPSGSQGPLVQSLDAMLHYYDVYGRTWERQAFIKARPIAGDLELGRELLDRLRPWIYRRYLSLTDISGIKSLKRRIEESTLGRGADRLDVKTGHGGIRDIEFVIQFLQLLNGDTLPEVCSGNTLAAIVALEQAGCLTPQERSILEENYRFLRKIEHRLQIMLDLQTHMLPRDRDELRKLAIRTGYQDTPQSSALDAFEMDLKNKTQANRRILDHLLHDLFSGDAQVEPEVDLVNDPDPTNERIHEVLGRYPFQDVESAYHNLMTLATEKIAFLSTRRCRHFLAAIAPKLLRAIADTPDPDSTLVNLSQVSDSLGGKGVLWELFSFHPPSLALVVRLCSACPYLSSILTSNPGMIDELMDSLLLEHLPTLDMLDAALADLCRGAEDLAPILHSFKDSQHLRVGIRDILGKDDVRETHAALSDIAEACLKRIAMAEYLKLVEKFGEPTIGQGDREDMPSELIILALGKLGGREPNYHSDLDIVFLYEADGHTVYRRRGGRSGTTTNQHFFSELGQRIIKAATYLGPYGRLYDVDLRLRPTGRSGALAVPLDEFRRYFTSGAGQLWERQALCKARVVYGSPMAADRAMHGVREVTYGPTWNPADAGEIRQMRSRLEESAGLRNLKRGPGGTVDVEFVVQMLQLKHGHRNAAVRVPGTLGALTALREAGELNESDFNHFSHSYRALRSIEARIRLMNAAGRHEMPQDEMELKKLAYLLNKPSVELLVQETENIRQENRRRFDQIFKQAENSA